jgi:hypothetical protein
MGRKLAVGIVGLSATAAIAFGLGVYGKERSRELYSYELGRNRSQRRVVKINRWFKPPVYEITVFRYQPMFSINDFSLGLCVGSPQVSENPNQNRPPELFGESNYSYKEME